MERGKRPPKRKPITEEQVHEMMRMRRQGRSIKAIAQAMGCHRQTVRMHLKERHADILADEARKQVLIDELRNHFRELAGFATVELKSHLRASRTELPGSGPEMLMPGRPISMEGTLGLPGPGSSNHAAEEWARMYELPSKEQHLMQALREHTKDSPLWSHWDGWRREVADYETKSRELFEWLVDKTEAELFQKIDPQYLGLIRQWLFGNLLLRANDAGYEYERLQMKGGVLTSAGREIARGGKLLYDYLLGILKEAEQRSEWGALGLAAKQLKENQLELRRIVSEIDSALDGIELMRAFPGRCHLCPV